MTADNWKPQKYAHQEPREMRLLPFENDARPEYLPTGVMALFVGVCVLIVAYLLASVL